MKNLLLLALFFVLISCATDDNEPGWSSPDTLKGTWVEASARMDTIIFEYSPIQSSTPMMVFKSSSEIGGYSGLYSTLFQYHIDGNTISLNNTISSCYCFDEYPFMASGKLIRIGNFYNPGAAGKLETFVKIE